MDALDILFVLTAFLFQLILIAHFALRKWRFATAMHYGPVVYVLGVPAAAVSLLLLAGGKAWSFWLSGFLYLVWGSFGYYVEYIRKIQWRSPVRWRVLVPYIISYLAMIMFYWFPLALVSRPLWFVYAVLFILSTFLNVASHRNPPDRSESL